MIPCLTSLRRQNLPPLRRWAALVCSVTYLAGGMEMLPETLALGAWLEGAHTVRVACDGTQVTVVLSHDRGLSSRSDFTPRHQPGSVGHRHGPAARLLCAFADHQSRQADHIAGFATASICEDPSDPLKAATATAALAFLTPVTLAASPIFCLSVPVSPSPDSFPARPPDSLRLLRSTVLVI
jgi:hypothetical protein